MESERGSIFFFCAFSSRTGSPPDQVRGHASLENALTDNALCRRQSEVGIHLLEGAKIDRRIIKFGGIACDFEAAAATDPDECYALLFFHLLVIYSQQRAISGDPGQVDRGPGNKCLNLRWQLRIVFMFHQRVAEIAAGEAVDDAVAVNMASQVVKICF